MKVVCAVSLHADNRLIIFKAFAHEVLVDVDDIQEHKLVLTLVRMFINIQRLRPLPPCGLCGSSESGGMQQLECFASRQLLQHMLLCILWVAAAMETNEKQGCPVEVKPVAANLAIELECHV